MGAKDRVTNLKPILDRLDKIENRIEAIEETTRVVDVTIACVLTVFRQKGILKITDIISEVEFLESSNPAGDPESVARYRAALEIIKDRLRVLGGLPSTEDPPEPPCQVT